MNIPEVQQLLLLVLPQWNFHIARPFKQILDDGVSLEMYYSLQFLRSVGGAVTMTEFSCLTQMPKQQATKMVNRLVEHAFVERLYDPNDRRTIRIRLTRAGVDYVDHFLSENAGCFRNLLSQMTEEDLEEFGRAIEILSRILPMLQPEPLKPPSSQLSSEQS